MITEKSVPSALSGMSDGKAAGSSGVVAEIIKASGEAGISLITQLFNTIIAEKKIPSDWDMSIIMKCYKGKGDATERGKLNLLKF